VNTVALDAVPPLVVTTILPVVAPVGTVAVIVVSEFAVKVAEVPLNVTLVACFRPVPVIVTDVPTGPLGGVNEVNVGFTLKLWELVSVVEPVVTVTAPLKAAGGTVAEMKVAPVRVMVVAATPPNLTTVVVLKP
jgi:hypothetical protein